MSTTRARRELPELPLTGWEETKNTLHLWAQIVGKVRMASTAPRNHWWHVTLYVDVRGLTTRRMHARGGVAFEIDFDFVEHRLVVTTNRGEVESFELADGLSVAAFDEKLHATLAAPRDRRRDPRAAVPACRRRPHSRTTTNTRRTTETRSSASGTSSSGRTRCSRSSRAGTAARRVPFTSSGTRSISRSPASAASARRRCPTQTPSTRRRTRTRWSRSASGRGTRTCGSRPTTRTPLRSPPAFVSSRCTPREASWTEYGNGSLALLPYDAVRRASDPRAALLAFLESAYRAGAGLSGWDQAALDSSWCPSPPELSTILAGLEPTPRAGGTASP